ncbi:Putative flippase GtrA (transmembrane translocase of bactoprenol-linked glucose) [Lentzea xinjiangensis]|uniref:Putative flippase GtrA (Transmembrane translocase of bactoprenol-linked glucose) n=1 Tax=Lentzea xinjiangensis TaxID=402600 RepID=A0A1H9F9R7_9PSEU|nr:GtrA family protein [Lentzea xinjiangensis]SEQ34696.1 Putative flippase GtrA (transmembrane translocase of bactoprenol-linked glucose) [Lentzea xinjiangensis]
MLSGDDVRASGPKAGLMRVLYEHSLVRFLLIGGASAALDTGVLYLLHGVVGMALPLATLVAVMVAFGFNFTLNRIWSFGSESPVGWQVGRYLLLAVANWCLNVALVTGLTALGMHYVVAKIVTLAIASAANYVGYRVWVFK